MAKSETKKMLAAAVAAAEDKRAVDLKILELDPSESGLTDYFLVMSGTNPRQIQTLADEIELRLKRDFSQMPNSREGYRQAEWVLLDYVDFIVHIFSEEKRAYYGLERLRRSAQNVALGDLAKKSAGKKTMPAKKTISKKPASKKIASAGARSRKSASKPTGKKTAAKSSAKKKR
jgi:ribosome-associated protein